jgi:hypothetical protein
MPITSRRALSVGSGRGETTGTAGNEAPEATGGGTKVLDVISVPAILSAPSGKTYGIGRLRAGSTRLSTNVRTKFEPPSTGMSSVWSACG